MADVRPLGEQSSHEHQGQVLVLCLREVDDWTAFVHHRGSEEYVFVGQRSSNDAEASLLFRSARGGADALGTLFDCSFVAEELALFPAAVVQRGFLDVLEAYDGGEGTSLVRYDEGRAFTRERALFLLRLLRDCAPR